MKCPSCQAEVSTDSKFCRNCGAELESVGQETACPGCGQRIQTGDKFCASCGESNGPVMKSPPPLTVVKGREAYRGKGAGVGVRAVATVLDMMILFALSFVLALESGGTTAVGFELQGGPFFLMTFLGFAYYVFFEWKLGGTPGKLALNLQVVKADGGKCDLQAVLIRSVCRIVDGLFCYFVAAVAVWSSERNQRLGDRLADTLVIKRDVGQSWRQMKDSAFQDAED